MAKGKDLSDLASEGAFLPSLTDADPGLPINEGEPAVYSNGHRGDRSVPPRIIVPTPFTWQDPKLLPQRQWLYGGHYIRKFISATIAPGGRGKSSLVLVEAIAMASGRNLLNVGFNERLHVWYWNGEDPQDEINRRVAAILLHFQIEAHEIEDWLFTDNGRDTPICIAERQKDLVVFGPDAAALETAIAATKIDVLILDPFIKTHGVPENDNGAIDRVARQYATIADRANCAIELPHHVRKSSTFGRSEVGIDDARGAVALIDAARATRVLNVMTEDEAAVSQVKASERRRYFRMDDGKANMMPPAEGATWFKLVSVGLGNNEVFEQGDWVGVVTPWKLPGTFDGIATDVLAKVQEAMECGGGPWAKDSRAQDWIGHIIAGVLRIDATEKNEVIRIQKLLKSWIESGAIKVEMQGRPDHPSRTRPCVVVGTRVFFRDPLDVVDA